MIHHQFCIIENHHQIKESLSLEENTKNTKINNLVSVKIKEWILSTPIILEVLLRLFYRSTYSLKFKGHTPIFLKVGFTTYSDYFRVPFIAIP